jgi:hypothetical protein
MKTPKTVKAYLKMLIQIAEEESINLNNISKEESLFIGYCRGDLQNTLGEDEFGILEKYDLKYNGGK